MEQPDQELLAEFVVESQEGLANVEAQLLAIETAGADVDTEQVNAVFRTMHSIKGAAGFLGLDRIGTLAHGLEEVLDDMRNREIVPSSELVTTILRAADFMKGLIEAVESSNEVDVTTHVTELHQFRAGAEPTAAATAPAEPPAEPDAPTPARAGAQPSIESAAPADGQSEAVREFLIECCENFDQMERDLVALEKDPTAESLIRNVFRTVHTVKGGAGFLGLGNLETLAHAAEELLGKLRSGQCGMTSEMASALLATADKCRDGLRLVEASGTDAGLDIQPAIEQLQNVDWQQSEAGGQSAAPAATCPPPKPQAPPAPAAEAISPASTTTMSPVDNTAAEKAANQAGDSTIRVDVALLDKLMTRVGELVLARNQILQHTNDLEDSDFISTAQRLNLITTELQEGVMKTRMQPIGNVWAKFPRVVRDLSAQLGKQVRIEMEGKDTELDKTIVESIKDPLTHLVRNSVDHGIESPEVRRAAGKPVEGCLCLRAYHEGGQVNIEISDDGAGLNLERIRKKAVERGLVAPDAASRMSEREAAQLILLPGFSTAEQVTSVSGRGVGMDVVKTNIERIGGTIDLQSQAGQGTTVRIKIPLTLAIIPALVVTCDGDRYAIPQVSLLELLRLEGSQAEHGIEYVHGAPVYRLRGKLLPLINLSERLGLTGRADDGQQAEAKGNTNIVVLRANERQFGLVVDKILDTEEIVVKPLSQQLKGLSEFAGATIMGDGTVALILDVMGLALASGVVAEMREQTVGHTLTDESKSSQQLETLLVVDLGDTRRFALPTSLVSRLERVSRSAIEHVDGREVIQYRGAILPLVKLSDVFGAAPNAGNASDDFQIIVYADEDQRCGLVVNRIVDIVETSLILETKKGSNDNLLGTAIIQQQATNVLNLRQLARYRCQTGADHSLAT